MTMGTTAYRGRQGILQEYSVPTGEAFGVGFEEAIAENPATKLLSWYEVENATGNQLTRDEALSRTKSRGVDIEIPDNGIKDDALEFLINRKYEAKQREDQLNRIKSGFTKSALGLAGNLVGSMLDPLNVASSFIPVGKAAYLAALQKAGGGIGAKLAVRAQFGALEGAVGAAAVEPFSYAASQQLGDDYTAADSLMNIAFGGVMGGGFHMGVGALGDAIDARFKSKKVSPDGKIENPDLTNIEADIKPMGEIPREIASFSADTRFELGKSSIAQFLEDRPVNIEALRLQALEAHAERHFDSARFLSDPTDFILDAIKTAREAKLSEPMLRRLDAAREAAPYVFRNLEAVELELSSLEGRRQLALGFESKAKRLAELDAILTRQEGLSVDEMRALADEENLLKSQATPEQVEAARAELPKLELEIKNKKKKVEKLSKRAAAAFREANKLVAPEKIIKDISDLAEKSARVQKGSNFIARDIVEKHRADIEALPKETQIEDAKAFADQAVADLDFKLKQMGVEDSAPFVGEAKEVAESLKTKANAIRMMAECLIRKG